LTSLSLTGEERRCCRH